MTNPGTHEWSHFYNFLKSREKEMFVRCLNWNLFVALSINISLDQVDRPGGKQYGAVCLPNTELCNSNWSVLWANFNPENLAILKRYANRFSPIIHTILQYWPESDETFAPVSALRQAATSAPFSCVQPSEKILKIKDIFHIWPHLVPPEPVLVEHSKAIDQ